MRYWIKATLGLVLFLGGLAAFEYGLYQVLQVGTCASGGPYVSARECPAGTAAFIASMPGGILLGLIGLGIFAARGNPPSGARKRIGAGTVGLIGWASLFVGTGAVCLYSSLAGDPGPGANEAGLFIGALFIPMGLIPVALALSSLGSSARGVALRLPTPGFVPNAYNAASARPAPPVTPQGDPMDRLRKLGQLRDAGVLSPAEFEAAKARILTEL